VIEGQAAAPRHAGTNGVERAGERRAVPAPDVLVG